LVAASGDDLQGKRCKLCSGRDGGAVEKPPSRVSAVSPVIALSPAEKGLVSRLYGFMETSRLLDLLNDRRVADIGAGAALVTFEQLQRETRQDGPPNCGVLDFPTLRKVIRQAERDGTLAAIDENVINDFAVVFGLNAKQVIGLKDALLTREDD
jgi:hypothetical protein